MCVKNLGINLPISQINYLSFFRKNFRTTLHEIKSILNIWLRRNLTSRKIIILENLTLSKIIYKATHMPILLHDISIKDFNQILYRLIWSSRWENSARFQLCCDVEGGARGANMTDIKCHILSLKSK